MEHKRKREDSDVGTEPECKALEIPYATKEALSKIHITEETIPPVIALKCTSNDFAILVHTPTLRQVVVLGELQGKGMDDMLPFKTTTTGFEYTDDEDSQHIGAFGLWEMINDLCDPDTSILDELYNDEGDVKEKDKKKIIVDLLGGEAAVRGLAIELVDVLNMSTLWIPTVFFSME